MFRNPLMAACFLNASLNCHVRYERTIYRLGKTTHTWSRIVIISNFWTKCTSCQLRITQKSNLKVKILKIFAGVFSRFLAHEIKPQQRICVCLGQITIFRNVMNEETASFSKEYICEYMPLFVSENQMRSILLSREATCKRFCSMCKLLGRALFYWCKLGMFFKTFMKTVRNTKKSSLLGPPSSLEMYSQ